MLLNLIKHIVEIHLFFIYLCDSIRKDFRNSKRMEEEKTIRKRIHLFKSRKQYTFIYNILESSGTATLYTL